MAVIIQYDQCLDKVIKDWVKIDIDQFELEDVDMCEVTNMMFYRFIDKIGLFDAENIDEEEPCPPLSKYKLLISLIGSTDEQLNELVTEMIDSDDEVKKEYAESMYRHYMLHLHANNHDSLINLLINNYVISDLFVYKFKSVKNDIIASHTMKLKEFIKDVDRFINSGINFSEGMESNHYLNYIRTSGDSMKRVKLYKNILSKYMMALGMDKVVALIDLFKVVPFSMDMYHYCSTCSETWDPSDVPREYANMNEDCKKVQIIINDHELEWSKEGPTAEALKHLRDRQINNFDAANSKTAYELIHIIMNIISTSNIDQVLESAKGLKLYAYSDSWENFYIWHRKQQRSSDDYDAKESWFNILHRFIDMVLPGFYILIEYYLYEYLPTDECYSSYEKRILKERDTIRADTGFDAVTLEDLNYAADGSGSEDELQYYLSIIHRQGLHSDHENDISDDGYNDLSDEEV